MNVRCGERLREHAARLVVEEAHLVDLEQLRQRDELRVPGARADDHDLQVVEVAQKRRGPDEGIEILRVPDVAGVHDHELLVEADVARPGVRFVQRPEPRQGGGRGLTLIDRLSTEWGVERSREGKVIWSQFDRSPS